MADKPKLTRAERKQIEAVIRKYRGDGKPHTAQDTIPYQIMYPDGICYLGNRRYSQSIEFFDINYLLAQPDDQTAIFEYLCDLYNYLDSSIHVQFTYPNRKSDREQLARSFEMPPCNDGLDPIRQEQTDILKRQLARGNNGSVKTKYITYTIEADNLKAARARLSRISLDIQGYFKIMGAVSRVLDGKERLEVLHGIMHPDGERFNFDWKWLAAGGLSTKDFIAPSSFAFKNSRMFQMGGKLCAASFLQIITPELTDRVGERFPVLHAYGCRSELQNGKTLWLADKPEYRKIGLAYARLRFTTESAEECVRVLRAYKGREEYTPKDITRGLFYRGVE